ncbi:MAG TPA: response regulator transcription factor [Eudoraea sp.]|nr:response regulator transcription factor [Eudoraea sp.]
MSDHKHKILLVEDDPALGYLLSEYLQMKGYALVWAKDGKEALEIMKTAPFDLAILDIMMPEMDGFTLASELKLGYAELPFIFLSAKSLKIDVLKGFALGAVDYIKKPIDEEELVARIEALLNRIGRRDEPSNMGKYRLGHYFFNSINQELNYEGETVHLTSRESELLLFLVANKNKLCSHKDILTRLWGVNDYFNKKSLNVFITHLRKHLQKDPGVKIENVHSRGFILRVEE